MAKVSSILTLTMNPVVDEFSEVSRVVPERKLRCSSPIYHPGGGGVNVARAIRNLGGEAQAVYPAGGAMGDFFNELVVRDGIPYRAIPIMDQTRVNFIISEKETGQQFRFGMPGPLLEENEWRGVLDDLAVLEPFPYYLISSGSLPRGVPDDFHAELSRVVAGRGGRLVVDASGEPLRHALEAGVFLVKPNLNELGVLAGRELEREEEIVAEVRHWIDAGNAQMVVISLGRGGALLVSDGLERWIRSPSVPLRSKVGAGDSMVAGMVHALAHGQSAEEAAMFGVACGAAAVMTPGTELCRRQDVERLYHSMVLGAQEAGDSVRNHDDFE